LRLDSRFVRFKNWFDTKMSNRIVPRADCVLTVSEPISEEMRTRYPNLAAADKVHTLMNAVDLEDFIDLPDIAPDPDHFTILYPGNFFVRRSPRPFLTGLEQLFDRHPELSDKVRVRFVGSIKVEDHAWLAERPQLASVVTVTPFKPYQETLAQQRAADL